jgi:NAD+ synthase
MFSRDVLRLDPEAEIDRITRRLREILTTDLRRRGAVVAVSGGIDSSVTAALAVRSLGPERVYLLLLPERDSSDDSTRLGRRLAEHLGAPHETIDIAPALEAMGCYAWRDRAYRAVFPDYGPGWRAKIVIAGNLLDADRFNFFKLIAVDPEFRQHEKRLPLKEYMEIVAATNFKQRVRKTFEYFHADRLNYAVTGTPNRLEYDQGFFVKLGDGAADVKPIAHLYKTQVYALAEALELPEEIRTVAPTTDTYSLPQGQDEFYFVLPHAEMDLALYAHDHGVSAAEAGGVLGYTEDQMARVYRDIEQKRKTTRYLHLPPVLIEDVLTKNGTASGTSVEEEARRA